MPGEDEHGTWRIPARHHIEPRETPSASPTAAAAAPAAPRLAAKSRFVPRPVIAPAAPAPRPAARAESAALAARLKAAGLRSFPTSRTGDCGPEALAAVLEHAAVCTASRGGFPKPRILAGQVAKQRALVVDTAQNVYRLLSPADRADWDIEIAETTPFSSFAAWAAAMRSNGYIDELYLETAGYCFNAVVVVTTAKRRRPRVVFPRDTTLLAPHPT